MWMQPVLGRPVVNKSRTIEDAAIVTTQVMALMSNEIKEESEKLKLIII